MWRRWRGALGDHVAGGGAAVFFVLALLVHAGQHGSGHWPYLLPLLVAGVLLGILSSALCYNAYAHSKRPHEVEL